MAQQLRELQDEVAFLREAGLSATAGQPTRDYDGHPNVSIGENCRLAPDVNIMASSADYRVELGDHVKINRRAEICGPVSIGDRTFINSDAYIRQQTRIGSRVLIGPFVRLISDTHEMGTTEQRAGKGAVAAITVEDGVWIGASVTVIGPVTIGAGSMVAAGALVVNDVPPNTLVGGVPAKVLREL
ncbi:acyltransferase [Paenarthrobacter ilicis]|uniref:acyltransferase n=1 Tax=Paenarthrobacter ilicis TaxID=43665 RepID=UPI0028D5901F|nr:acyltransferase [Paenarthrobacter ilicis]